jgi:hypothetical protein
MDEHRCLRCQTVPLSELESPGAGVQYFECPRCHRQYAQRPGKGLTFRWLHPISLVLYLLLFRPRPRVISEDILQFVTGRPPGFLKAMVEEIRLELDNPTQQVRDILDMDATEGELRDYLRAFVTEAEGTLKSISGH